MQNVSLLWDGQWFYTLRQEKRTDLHTPCHFWYLIPPIFSLFASYWPIYSLLRVKIHNIKKSVSHCLLFQKWCTCQLPWGKGRRVLLHLPFFDKHTASLVSFFSLPPSLSFHLPLWFLLSLSLNVRWEEAARIIGHASVGLFDHVTRRRLHTYVPLNKPSNVAPEAEHGSKGSGGPVLCNDGKMEQFCLCWFYVCVCVCLDLCVCVWLSAATQLWGLQLGLHFCVVHVLSPPPPTKKKKLKNPHMHHPNARGSLRAKAWALMHNLLSHFTIYTVCYAHNCQDNYDSGKKKKWFYFHKHPMTP